MTTCSRCRLKTHDDFTCVECDSGPYCNPCWQTLCDEWSNGLPLAPEQFAVLDELGLGSDELCPPCAQHRISQHLDDMIEVRREDAHTGFEVGVYRTVANKLRIKLKPGPADGCHVLYVDNRRYPRVPDRRLRRLQPTSRITHSKWLWNLDSDEQRDAVLAHLCTMGVGRDPPTDHYGRTIPLRQK